MSSPEEVRKRVDEITSTPLETLLRSDLGSLSFQPEEPLIAGIITQLARVGAARLESFPSDLVQQLHRHLQNISKAFDRLTNIDVRDPSFATQQRNDAIQHLQTVYGNAVPFITQAVVLGSTAEGETEAQERLEIIVDDAEQRARTQLDQAEQRARTQLDQIERIVDAAKKASQLVGVSKHAGVFATEARSNQAAAKHWLIVSVALFGITLVFGGILLWRAAFYMPTNLTTAQNVQRALAKVLILSVLVSATIASTRVYRAQLHNETVNKHRHNALLTFETFANAAVDDHTKSAVLTQATQCIFSPQHTGFIADDREATGYPQIFEVVRNIPSKDAP